MAIRPVGHATGWRMFDGVGVRLIATSDAIRSESADPMEIRRPASIDAQTLLQLLAVVDLRAWRSGAGRKACPVDFSLSTSFGCAWAKT